MLNLRRPKNWQQWLRNLTLFLVLVYALEFWQSRHLTRGALPDSLRLESLPTVDSRTRSLWSPEHYTVLYVFAPWCGVCRASGTNIDRLPDGFQKAALALSWSKREDVEGFVRDAGLRVPVLLGGEQEEAALGVAAYPSYVIIDPQGRIVKAWQGYTTTAGLWFRSYLARLF